MDLELFKLLAKSVVNDNIYISDFIKEISKTMVDQCKSFRDLALVMYLLN